MEIAGVLVLDQYTSMTEHLLRALDRRLGIRSAIDTLRRTRPKTYLSPLQAPPISLGRIGLFLLVLLVLSGVILTFFYNPTAEGAAASLAFFHHEVPLGWLVHNTHRWSALLLLLFVSLHVLRSWVTRSFLYPRDLNWWTGTSILLIVLFMGGTGYLLRWDIKAFVLMDLIISNLAGVPVAGTALTTMILGRSELDVVPLYRGYALHIWFLPLVLFLLVTLHLIVVWLQGLAEVPVSWQRLRQRLPFKGGVTILPGLMLLALVIALSVATPHEGLDDPVALSPWPHPDWLLVFYFLPFWFFQGDFRVIGALVIPTLVLGGMILAPRLRFLWSKRVLMVSMLILGAGWVLWLWGQTGSVGSQIPMQGCTACHRPTIIGGAPTQLSEFDIRDPDWLIFHLRDPQGSLLVPFATPTPTKALPSPTPPNPQPHTQLDIVANGLSRPLGLTHAGDGSGRLFVLEKYGHVHIIEDGKLLPNPFLVSAYR